MVQLSDIMIAKTKLEKYRKGDFVYVQDPAYKRGKAKKCSYQYKGPFEIEQKISPLFTKYGWRMEPPI
jgi:hypothetical protein